MKFFPKFSIVMKLVPFIMTVKLTPILIIVLTTYKLYTRPQSKFLEFQILKPKNNQKGLLVRF